ncbi:MAG: Mu transposase C-terminal domain-containing protein, partial [Deltaproteobacteria bacterium]|nr:Mu transposase C-terminal domain-containing protein [Deltaproteobacteria bacterium]
AETAQQKKSKRVRRGASRAGSLLPEVALAVPALSEVTSVTSVTPAAAAYNTNSTETISIDMRSGGEKAPIKIKDREGSIEGSRQGRNCRRGNECGDQLSPANHRGTERPGLPSFPMSGLLPARRYSYEDLPAWSPERAISGDALRNHRVAKILAVLREVDAMPRDFAQGADAWKNYVALTHGVAKQSIYRWIQKFDKRGIAGLEHRKSNAGKSKAWSSEALDFWIGLTLKPEHRKIDLSALYEDALLIEAGRRGWDIGCYESAVWWHRKKATPLLLAMQNGGMRALDNLLPPVLRDYSDLAPFECLVGDQHRFDFWCIDDDTGAVFRPECFLWQDLRTRILYGMAFDKHYDAHLCGLALRVGIHIFGVFNSIYTDNGKPELSKYMMGILSAIRSLGMEWNLTEDAPMDVLDVDAEEVDPVVVRIEPGTHKKAVIKNAKAKMNEGTFSVIENILRSRFRVAGSVKRLTDDPNSQDMDHEEAMKLAKENKLLLASEFYLTCYRAADYYNREKVHRGVRKEWIWKPKPAEATPYECLMAGYADGWRPRWISDEAADHIFLKRQSRTVQLGRITIDGEIYEHDALLGLPQSQRVDCRFNPLERDVILVYLDEKFLCPAHPVEYSSMKNEDLAKRKIMEKRTKRKAVAEGFRAIIKNIPDLREYSKIPEAEKVAAVVGEEKKRIEAARANLTRALAPEELAAEMVKMEALNERLPDGRTAAFAMSAIGKPIPPRPSEFMSRSIRYEWCLQCEVAGGELSTEDRAFVAEEETKMTPAQRERWQFEREHGREYGNG